MARMISVVSLLAIAALLAVAACTQTAAPQGEVVREPATGANPGAANPGAITPQELELRMEMRKLWGEHVAWTRMYLVSAIGNDEDTDLVAERLLRNQEDIGNAIKPYYGEDAGNQLTALLEEHIAIAVDIIAAAKANDSAAQQAAEDRWTQNANDIASFLASANPNWPEEEIAAMLSNHLRLTREEAVARLTKDYAADIAAYDRVEEQILEMADGFSDGIVRQFPERFQ